MSGVTDALRNALEGIEERLIEAGKELERDRETTARYRTKIINTEAKIVSLQTQKQEIEAFLNTPG